MSLDGNFESKARLRPVAAFVVCLKADFGWWSRLGSLAMSDWTWSKWLALSAENFTVFGLDGEQNEEEDEEAVAELVLDDDEVDEW